MESISLRTPADIGALLRARRRELNMDQVTLAKNIGVSRLWVSQIERGKPGANLGLVLRALSAVGVTLRGIEGSLSGKSAAPGMTWTPPIDINAIIDRARGKDVT